MPILILEPATVSPRWISPAVLQRRLGSSLSNAFLECDSVLEIIMPLIDFKSARQFIRAMMLTIVPRLERLERGNQFARAKDSFQSFAANRFAAEWSSDELVWTAVAGHRREPR